MWMPARENWNFPTLEEALRSGELGVVVGNGLSRLAGAPSWNELFLMPEVVDALRAEGIDPRTEMGRGTSLLELAELIPATAINHMNNRLQAWQAKARPTLVHELIFQLLRPRIVYTFNFDSLLVVAKKGEVEPKVHGLHGSLEFPDQMAFSESGYRAAETQTMKSMLSATAQVGALLFIGYGHSYDDYDVRHALAPKEIQEARIPAGKLFTILSSHEKSRVMLRRLDRSHIQPLIYSLPANASGEARVLALSDALIGFAQDVLGVEEVEKRAAGAMQKVEELKKLQAARNRQSTIVIGLSAINRISDPGDPDFYPRGARRNVRCSEIEEPGGPGLMVAKMLSTFRLSATLVSSLVDDAPGVALRQYLETIGANEAPIDLDYLHMYQRWVPENARRSTWSSYVLLHPSKFGQRVFLDKAVPSSALPKSGPEVDVCAELIRDYPPEFIYFDKFYEDAANKLLRRPGGEPLSRETITVYETGSDGDRSRDYSFEKDIADKRVNIVTSSFRFARDYLASNQGQLDPQIWSLLEGGKRLEGVEEIELIQQKIIDDASNREALIRAIRRGAQGWLRTTGPRIVIVTLHQHGSLWILVDEEAYGLVPVQVSDSHFNFSAGDVFRGALLAGMIHARRRWGLESLTSESILSSLCEFANTCARIKVESPSFGSTLPMLQPAFTAWKQRLELRSAPATV